MNFARYSNHCFDGLSFDQLLAEQRDHGMLFARAENSGSEACYVEVAIWNAEAKPAPRFERYAFRKFFSGELEIAGKAEPTAREVADHVAQQINDAGHVDQYQSLIHNFPNYSGKEAVKTA